MRFGSSFVRGDRDKEPKREEGSLQVEAGQEGRTVAVSVCVCLWGTGGLQSISFGDHKCSPSK